MHEFWGTYLDFSKTCCGINNDSNGDGKQDVYLVSDVFICRNILRLLSMYNDVSNLLQQGTVS